MGIRKIYTLDTEKLMIGVIILLICIYLIIYASSYTKYKQKSYISTPQGIQSNKPLFASGYINPVHEAFPDYTHQIKINNKVVIGLKSPTINLNHFGTNDFVEIHGIIRGTKYTTIVADVVWIRVPEQYLFIKDNIYTYIRDQVVINLQNIPSVTSKKGKKRIIILTDNIPVIKMEKLECGSSAECVTYIKNLETDKNTISFISVHGYTYYKIHAGYRIVTDQDSNRWEIYGEDENVIDFSPTIQFINSDYFLQEYKKQLFAACEHLDIVNSSSLQREKLNPKIYLLGKDIRGNKIECLVSMDIRNGKGVTHVSLKQ